MKEKVRLSHVVLYAKGWYERTNNIFDDLKKMLELDEYTPFTNGDIVSIIVNNYERSFNIKLSDFINDTHPDNCWKIGYYTDTCDWVKDYKSLPKYDYHTAVLYKILSDFRFIDNTKWDMKIPKYSKNNKRPKNIELKDVINQFNKK